MCKQIEHLLRVKRYDWIVVQGDTATAAAAATAAFLNRTPIAHVEAGLRTGDLQSPWPEEFYRRLITQAATLHFPPTRLGWDNLLREGITANSMLMVGNTVIDALIYARTKMSEGYVPINPSIGALPADKKVVLATLHRRENIGRPLRNILRALRTLSEDGDKIIVLPMHLNPDIRGEVLRYLKDAPNVRLLDALQYPDFVYLLSKAWTVVTDSGGVQEEAPTFGLQILITRNSTERPEVVDAGFGRLVGSDFRAIVDGVRRLTAGNTPHLLTASNPFGCGDSAERIASRLTGQNSDAGRVLAA
jgi:UDP-N-acetylglucosamine 2-epimerase